MPKPGDRYQDGQGRTFELVDRVDPYGIDVKPYWRCRNADGVDLGRWSTVREDRLGSDYEPAPSPDEPEPTA